MRLHRKAPTPPAPTEFCRLCEAPSAPNDSLCPPCRQWADAGYKLPNPSQVCNAAARALGFPETY